MPAISPWLIAAAVASAAASVGGTAATMVSQAAIKKKQNQATEAERVRQRQITQQKDATMAANVPKYERPAQDLQQKTMADQIQQYLTPPAKDTSTEYVAQNPGAPKEVTDSLSRQLAGALSTGKGYAKDLANVSSYSRVGLNNTLGMNRLGEQMGALNNQSGRSTGILGQELQGASGAGVPGANMAAILQGVGGIADAGVGYGLMTKVPKPVIPGNGASFLTGTL